MRYSFLLIAGLLLSGSMTAQLNFTLSSNIASQPLWGPVGHDNVRYYYLPDIETYYYVPGQRFYYYEGGRWIGSSQLPPRYRAYDFYHSYKVVVNEPRPYRNHKMYKAKYFSYKGRRDQQLIRDSHDARYYVVKGHPDHDKWVKQPASGNPMGKSKGNNQGNKQGKKN